VDDPPGANSHDDEDIGDGEENGVLGQEVTGLDLLGVVTNEPCARLGSAGTIGARSPGRESSATRESPGGKRGQECAHRAEKRIMSGPQISTGAVLLRAHCRKDAAPTRCRAE